MEKPCALVIRTAGTNCDAEMCRGFRLAGADARLVHVNALIDDPALLERADLVGFPGGFSHGDDIAAGRVLGVRLRTCLWGPLRDAAERGVPMIGICNGFQVMAQVGLLPGFPPGAWPDTPPEPTIGLAENTGGRYIDRWLGIEVDAASPCVWTRHLPADPAIMRLPIGHAEGRLVADDESVLDQLEADARIPIRYAEGENVNGSSRRIAGVCDPGGRIFGLMPHPDRFLSWHNHPFAERIDRATRRAQPPGLSIFQNAVASVAAGARHAGA